MPYLMALFSVICVFAWTVALFMGSRRALRSPPPPLDPDQYLWVFLVPALNEQVTVADSVDRLLQAECAHRIVLVIDDGSTDGTSDVLAAIDAPELEVLRRDLPEAQTGKAAALNAAYRHLDSVLAAGGRFAGWPREQVICVVVDADGRLDPQAPAYLAGHLADPRVGGIQVLVRIYNRAGPLTWLQDVEFSIYGLLYQSGRTPVGTAGMGGNGQCNRLAALDAVAVAGDGPWRDRLTEDQDLGLRLIEAGWWGTQESRVSVNQQGLSNLRRLLRQRTRWAQGNLQAIDRVGALTRMQRPRLARYDLAGFLLLPFLQAVLFLNVVGTIVFIAFDFDRFRDATWQSFVALYLLSIGGVAIGCIAWGLRDSRWGVLRGYLVAHVYILYTYLLLPALARAFGRQLAHRSDWAKTAREPLQDPAETG